MAGYGANDMSGIYTGLSGYSGYGSGGGAYGANDMSGSVRNLYTGAPINLNQMAGVGGTGGAMPGATGSGSITSSSGSMSGGGALGDYPLMPDRVSAPNYSNYNYSSDATNYPTFMKNLGENNAQNAFQNQVNSGIRLGNSGQSFMHAQDQMNNSRLGYMNQAGQAQMTVEQTLAAENERRNQLQQNAFGINAGQRGDEIRGLAAFYNARARAQSSGWNTTGGSWSAAGPTSGNSTVTLGGGTRSPAPTNYTDIYGNRDSYSGFSSQNIPATIANGGNSVGWSGYAGSSNWSGF